MKVVGNLKDLIGQAASEYISLNAEDFRSTTPGPQGIQGIIGPQGVGVHHLKGTSTTDSEGDFSTAGETDTYTFYPDANETYPLGWFRVKNGEDPWKRATDRGFLGTETEFYTMLANVEEYYVSVSADAEAVETQSAQVAVDAAQVAADRLVVEAAKEVAVAKSEIAEESASIVQGIFLGPKNSDPTVDNEGNPLIVGTMYFNTVGGTLRIWTGTEWTLGAFSVAGSVVTFNGRDGAVLLYNSDVTSAVGKDLSDAIKYSEADKVLTDVNKIAISTDVSLTTGVGEITWNQDESTINVGLNGAMLQVGQEQLVRVRNGSASSIGNGKVVMATGTVGNSGRIVVGLANVNQVNAKRVVGIATEDIAAGADGFVTAFGKVRGINTTGSSYGETWVDGDVLYVKDSGSGSLTKVEPAYNEVKMPIAIVVHAHTSGTLFVRASGIDENHDKVELASKAAIVSPTFSGTPSGPTASVGTNTTQLATTEFVVNEINKVEEW